MLILSMHEFSFVFIYIIGLAIMAIIYKVNPKRKYKFIVYMLALCYILLLFSVTVLPIYIIKNPEIRSPLNGWKMTLGLQYIPFYTIIGNFSSKAGWLQFVGNIILLVPLTFYMVCISKVTYTVKKVIIILSFTSLSIEMMQLLINITTRFPCHAVDIDDYILNVAGGMLAFCIFSSAFIQNIWAKLKFRCWINSVE